MQQVEVFLRKGVVLGLGRKLIYLGKVGQDALGSVRDIRPADMRGDDGVAIVRGGHAHQQFRVIQVEKPGQHRIMLRCENGEFVVNLLAVIPILVPAPVIVFQQSGPVGHGPERLLLQREQGQFLHHPGHRAARDAVRQDFVFRHDHLRILVGTHAVIREIARIEVHADTAAAARIHQRIEIRIRPGRIEPAPGRRLAFLVAALHDGPAACLHSDIHVQRFTGGNPAHPEYRAARNIGHGRTVLFESQGCRAAFGVDGRRMLFLTVQQRIDIHGDLLHHSPAVPQQADVHGGRPHSENRFGNGAVFGAFRSARGNPSG